MFLYQQNFTLSMYLYEPQNQVEPLRFLYEWNSKSSWITKANWKIEMKMINYVFFLWNNFWESALFVYFILIHLFHLFHSFHSFHSFHLFHLFHLLKYKIVYMKSIMVQNRIYIWNPLWKKFFFQKIILES